MIPVTYRRLLRDADCSACADDRSGPRLADPCIDLANLGAKKDYEEVLAKMWRHSTDEDALVLRLNVQANFPEQRRAQDGPLIGYIAIYSLPDGVMGLLRKHATGNPLLGLLVIPGAARSTRVLQFDKRSGAYHTSFNHQRSTKSLAQAQKCMQTKWRDVANLKAHISSRAFPRKNRYVGVFFFFWNAVFSHTPLEDFSQTNGNR